MSEKDSIKVDISKDKEERKSLKARREANDDRDNLLKSTKIAKEVYNPINNIGTVTSIIKRGRRGSKRNNREKKDLSNNQEFHESCRWGRNRFGERNENQIDRVLKKANSSVDFV